MVIWVRVLDLILAMMNVAYDKLIKGWVGDYLKWMWSMIVWLVARSFAYEWMYELINH